jgi:hypothetical protein
MQQDWRITIDFNASLEKLLGEQMKHVLEVQSLRQAAGIQASSTH